MLEYFIIMILMVGCSYTSYSIGVKTGAEGCLKELLKIKVIHVDNDGNLKAGNN